MSASSRLFALGLATALGLLTACAGEQVRPPPSIGRAAPIGLAATTRPAPAAGPAWIELPPVLAVHPDTLTPGLLRFTPAQPEIFTLGNGLVVYFLPDPTLPLAEVTLMIQAGEVWEPAGQGGLADATARAMREGGAGKLGPEALDARLDFLGGSLEVSSGDEATWANLQLLSKDLSEGVGLLADVVLRPRFDPERLDVVKIELQGEIERRPDDPGGEAWRALRKAVYGPTSPWAAEATAASVAKLDVRALKGWHAAYFHPGAARLVLTGNIAPEQARALAEQHFGPKTWPAHEVKLPELARIPREHQREVILVPRKIAQAKVRIGHLGYTRRDPREYAIRLADSVLGGAMFVSRLAREIRSNRGLAYSISSSTGAGKDIGLFAITADTAPEKVPELLEASLGIHERMAKEPAISDAELALGKDRYVNAFAFRFDTARKAAVERAVHDYYGYAPEYLPTFPERIAATQPSAVEAAAKEIFRPEQVVIVVVGDPARLGDLSRFGPVRTITDVEGWK